MKCLQLIIKNEWDSTWPSTCVKSRRSLHFSKLNTNTISTYTSLQQTAQAYLPEYDRPNPQKTDLHNLPRESQMLCNHIVIKRTTETS